MAKPSVRPGSSGWRGIGTAVRRIGAGVVVAALLGIAGCGTGASAAGTGDIADIEPRADGDGKLVLTTFTVLADMARNVAGDALEVESITKPGAEIHGYEPTPSDLRRAADADLILDNGLGLELWFEQFIERTKAQRATLTQGIEPISIASGDYEGEANPHTWMSPRLAVTYVENIRDTFVAYDPDNADTYRANAKSYIAEIEQVEDFLATELGALPDRQRALVTCEGAFSYLARDLDLEEHYLWPVNSDGEGTPQQIADLVRFVEDSDVPAIFCESTVSDKSQQQVARQTGTEMGGTLYVDSLSEADGPVPTYLELLRHDAETIVAGLVGSDS